MKLYELLEVIGIAEHIQIDAIGTENEARVYDGAVSSCPYFRGRTLSEAITNADILAASIDQGVLCIDIQGDEISKIL